jgi:hypothetical protein
MTRPVAMGGLRPMLESVVEGRDERTQWPVADPHETGPPPSDPAEIGLPIGLSDDLRLHAEALARVRAARRQLATWQRPGFIREVNVVRAHLAAISSLGLLAASFGREASRRDEDMPTFDRAAVDVSDSPVHLAYAMRWLELTGAADRTGSPPHQREERVTPARTREGDRARRSSLTVRLGDSRRRRLSANAVLSSRQPATGRAETRSRPNSGAEVESLLWFG